MSALAEQPHRHLRPRGVATLLVIAQVALVVGALTVPLSFAWLRQRALQLGLQTLVGSSAALPALGPLSARPALLVLAYHNVQEHPSSPYSVTPRQFADHMHMLRVGGYSAASGEDVLAALAGRPITGHKVLITFDDGAKGIWTYADPILARYGFRAMAFIITGAVDTHQPYYVTWRELAAMHSSGRWDLESHTNQGHGTVPVTADGARGPFLASREWLVRAARAETMAEYTSRVGTDLARSGAAFVAHGLPAPRFLAFPFFARGHPSNDPRIPNLLQAIVSKQFVAGFDNDSSAGALTPKDLRDGLLPRIEVTGSTTALALHAKLRQAAPRTVAEANLRRATDWCCGASTPSVVVDSHGDLRLPGTKLTSWRIATYGPADGEAWTSYVLSARVHGLTSPGTAAALLVGTQGRAGLRVVVERASVRVVTTDPTGITRELAWRTLSFATSHRVAVRVRPTGAEISVDGRAQMRVPVSAGLRAGSIGLGTFRTLSSQDVWFEDVQLRGP